MDTAGFSEEVELKALALTVIPPLGGRGILSMKTTRLGGSSSSSSGWAKVLLAEVDFKALKVIFTDIYANYFDKTCIV